MFNLRKLIICAIITSSFLSCRSWDLSNYNISSNYYVSSVATFGTRAFLALPRSSCHNNVTSPTLVEVSWFTEQLFNFFSRRKPFFLDSQIWNNCEHLQDAVSVDMEPIRSRLWVLDRGNANCPAKIVVYNLFQKINYTADIPEAPKNALSQLIIDDDIKLNGARAYIGLDGENYLLVFSLLEFKWWKINLHSTEPVSTKYLTFSRKEPLLYITGSEEREIFTLNLFTIRKQVLEDIENVNITQVGEKLGASSGLVADLKDGLTYFLLRDYAVVRWDTRNPSQAEYYSILAQSYEQLPYVSQLCTGPQNGIWALANPGDPSKCEEPVILKKRLVKILKYNGLI